MSLIEATQHINVINRKHIEQHSANDINRKHIQQQKLLLYLTNFLLA